MRRRILMVLGLALVVGVAASLLMYRVAVQVGAPTASEASAKVVVAAANIAMAETVTPAHVKLVDWPRASVPDGALTDVAAVQGRVARTSFTAGEPLLESRLAPQLAGKGGVMPMLVPEGQRGVTIKVDEAVRESGFVLPGSRVDVLVSMAKSVGGDRVAKLILQNVPVLAAGQSVEMRDNRPVTVTTVTLALSPDQSERLALAQTEGRVVLATRNLRDEGLVATRGVTSTTLLAEESRAAAPAPAARAAAPRRAVAKPPALRTETVSVSVIRGPRVSEQQFTRIEEGPWTERREEKK